MCRHGLGERTEEQQAEGHEVGVISVHGTYGLICFQHRSLCKVFDRSRPAFDSVLQG
jgi:hypothetical protein